MRRVVHIKVFEYTDEARRLHKGFSFPLVEEDGMEVLLGRVRSKFDLRDCDEAALRRDDGSYVDDTEELEGAEVLELEVVQGEEEILSNTAEKSEAEFRKRFHMGLFPSITIVQGVPRGDRGKIMALHDGTLLSVLYEESDRVTLVDGNDWHYSMYRCILPNPVPPTLSIGEIRKQRWCFILCHGGKFAYAMYEAGNMMEHRTLSRYVQRKKQGKRQLNHDKKGSTAPSSGSLIRRYQETKLQEEIQSILLLFHASISSSDCIFVHAPGPNRASLYFTNSPLHTCPSIRSIPIRTGTAVLAQIRHVFWNLGTVTVAAPADFAP